MSGRSAIISILLAVTGVCIFSAAAPAADAFTVTLAVKSVSGSGLQAGFARTELDAVVKKEGKPVSGVPVSWEVVSVENRAEAIPRSAKNKIDGLGWDRPAPYGEKAGVYHTATDVSGRAGATLADVMGERVVTVAAVASYGGNDYRAEQTVVFGRGPLSLFAAPLPEPVTWLEFYERCNGKPYPGNPADWQIGMGFVGGEAMPSLEQMQSVSMPSAHNTVQGALGAAVAAGWPTDRRYWNGRAVMRGRASHMDILTGTHHGSGGNDVTAKEYGVCLR